MYIKTESVLGGYLCELTLQFAHFVLHIVDFFFSFFLKTDSLHRGDGKVAECGLLKNHGSDFCTF